MLMACFKSTGMHQLKGNDGSQKVCALESEDSEFIGRRRFLLLKGFPIQVGQ